MVPNAIIGLKSETCSPDTQAYLKSIQFYPILEELMKEEVSLGLTLAKQAKPSKYAFLKLGEEDPLMIKKADEISGLIKDLLSARRELVSAKTCDANAQNKFTNDCSKALEKSRPTLAQHTNTAGMIFKGIVSFLMLPVFIYQALNGQLTKTKSEVIINTLQDKMSKYKKSCTVLRQSNPPSEEEPAQKSNPKPHAPT